MSILHYLFIPLLLIKKQQKQYPNTDHCEHNVFFNPGFKTKKKSFFKFLNWIFYRKKPAWPPFAAVTIKTENIAIQANEKLKVTYVGHATTLVEVAGFTFLTDPIWSNIAGPLSLIGVKRISPPGIQINSMEKVDAVFISHNHYDHLDLKTLKKLDKLYHPMFFVPLGVKRLLKSVRIKNVTELDWWEKYSYKNATITLLPAKHWSGRGLYDRFKTLWSSYGIEIDNIKIYFAGDTGYGTHFKTIATKWGNPMLALLPIGAYEPRWFMKSNHLNPGEAVKAFQDLRANYALGIHFDVFQLGDEKFRQAVHDLKSALQKERISNDAFFTLDLGEGRRF